MVNNTYRFFGETLIRDTTGSWHSRSYFVTCLPGRAAPYRAGVKVSARTVYGHLAEEGRSPEECLAALRSVMLVRMRRLRLVLEAEEARLSREAI